MNQVYRAWAFILLRSFPVFCYFIFHDLSSHLGLQVGQFGKRTSDGRVGRLLAGLKLAASVLELGSQLKKSENHFKAT